MGTTETKAGEGEADKDYRIERILMIVLNTRIRCMRWSEKGLGNGAPCWWGYQAQAGGENPNGAILFPALVTTAISN